MFASFPGKGGTLAYSLLRGLQLPCDLPRGKVYAPGANACQKLVEVLHRVIPSFFSFVFTYSKFCRFFFVYHVFTILMNLCLLVLTFVFGFSIQAGVAVKELTDFYIHYQSKNDQNLALLAGRERRITELTLEVERASSSLMTANTTVQSMSLERDRLNAEVIALRSVGESLAQTREEMESKKGRVAELADQLHSSEQRHARNLRTYAALCKGRSRPPFVSIVVQINNMPCLPNGMMVGGRRRP